jgi:hypothetical protein
MPETYYYASVQFYFENKDGFDFSDALQELKLLIGGGGIKFK